MYLGVMGGLVVIVVWLAIIYSDVRGKLARIERKLNMLLEHAGIDLPQGQPLSDRVKEIARDPGRKIEAIKEYREETGVGLAEAKQAVEEYMHSQS